MSGTHNPIHSTGRGGAGNIGADPTTTYVDGEVIREGTPGISSNPEYSAGRGGAGNIHPAQHPTGGVPASEEIVPESATRMPGESYENFHTGRGGEGNVHREKYGGHSHAQKEGGSGMSGFVEKAKHAVGLDGKKEKTPEPVSK